LQRQTLVETTFSKVTNLNPSPEMRHPLLGASKVTFERFKEEFGEYFPLSDASALWPGLRKVTP